MFPRRVWIFFLATALGKLVNAQRFHNPVIDGGDYPDPGVILYNGVYYAVTTTNSDKAEKYPIHTSTDLQNWTQIGYIFNASNFPKWSTLDGPFWAPEIHQIGDRFNVYFTAYDAATDHIGIGLASSDSITGPYIPTERPFLVSEEPGIIFLDSTVMNYDGHPKFIWVETRFIRIRNLTDDGLAFKDDISVTLLYPDQPWEAVTNEGPWYCNRNGYHYIFYSGAGYCDDSYALGVARSKSPAGPYEKRQYPLLVSNDQFKGPGHGSVVRDTDGEGYVFVHHAWKAGAVCGDNYRLMFSSSMKWGNDDWPLNMTIGG